ncbi:hypothetical protein GCM10017764_14450 [Sphingobacterium griseoflavum]|uniref:Uncharacterized protein n=1 Tax=Sphingobacterium griseoflavum TaxID=1474952 RepID=A0ABQ3HYC3_9SPHI|nr:hypothetical protein GCM10017764_14450 [Sphingobacterium griseoflavum]
MRDGEINSAVSPDNSSVLLFLPNEYRFHFAIIVIADFIESRRTFVRTKEEKSKGTF